MADQVQYLEDVELGDDLPVRETVPTPEQVGQFIEVAKRHTPHFFTDAHAARAVGFEGPIVPGDMSMALLARAVTSWAPTGTLKRLDVVFRRPVPHQRPVRVAGMVTDVDETEEVVTCDLYILNEEGERLVGGTAVVALPSQEMPEKA